MRIRLLGAHRRHRVITAASAIALIGGIAGTATSASAGPLPITTTTTLTSVVAEDASHVTLTAQVKVLNLNNGLGVTPKGTVHFADDAGDDLGTFPMPGCLLKPCYVYDNVPASALSDGVTTITATYSGDILIQGSSSATPVGVGRCGDGGSCFAYADQNNAAISASSDSDTGYIVDSLGGPGLPCGVVNGGPVANVTAYNLDSGKEIYYTLSGAGAEAYANQLSHLSEGRHWFCYVSPDPFQAFSQDGMSVDFPDSDASFATYDWAPQIGSGPYTDEYVGLLGDCPSDYDGPTFVSDSTTESPSSESIVIDQNPCISGWNLYQNPDNGNQWELGIYLETPAGDPHMGGLQLPALPKLALLG